MRSTVRTWVISVALEEQFYLIWPVLIFFIPPRALPRVLVLLVVAGPAFRLATADVLQVARGTGRRAAEAAYFLTFCQFAAFSVGAVVAVFRQTLERSALRSFLICTVIVMILGQIQSATTGSIAWSTSFGYPLYMAANREYVWGYTALNLWAASLVAVACGRNVIAKALSWRPLVHVGRVSYGMYVLHPLVHQVTRMATRRLGLFRFADLLIYFIALVVVCTVVYRWYELPFLRAKERVTGAEPVLAWAGDGAHINSDEVSKAPPTSCN